MFQQFGWGIHAYAEGGHLDNLDFQGNISFNNGGLSGGWHANILVGGTQHVATNPKLNANYTYNADYLSKNDLGYAAGCTSPDVTNNYLVGDQSLDINGCSSLLITGNSFVGPISGFSAVVLPEQYLLRLDAADGGEGLRPSQRLRGRPSQHRDLQLGPPEHGVRERQLDPLARRRLRGAQRRRLLRCACADRDLLRRLDHAADEQPLRRDPHRGRRTRSDRARVQRLRAPPGFGRRQPEPDPHLDGHVDRHRNADPDFAPADRDLDPDIDVHGRAADFDADPHPVEHRDGRPADVHSDPYPVEYEHAGSADGHIDPDRDSRSSDGHANAIEYDDTGSSDATPTRTATSVPPTATRTPSNTTTPVPPTATPTRTATSVPPTATRTPSNTTTAVPPTATPTRTATSVPPTATRTPSNTTTASVAADRHAHADAHGHLRASVRHADADTHGHLRASIRHADADTHGHLRASVRHADADADPHAHAHIAGSRRRLRRPRRTWSASRRRPAI